MTAPVLPLATAFAAGVSLGLAAPPPGWLPAAGLGLGLLIALATRRDRRAVASAGALLLVGLAGWARTALPDPLPATMGLHAGRLQLEGIVSGDPETEGPRTRLLLLLQRAGSEAGWAPAAGSLLVHLYGPAPPLGLEDRIRVTVDLSEPRPFRNPGSGGLTQAMPRGPRFLAIGRADAVERLPAAEIPWWLRVRVWIHRVVQRELPPVSAALFEGLLVGERRQLPPSLLADFRAAGVFHILAISGFNVALVTGAAFFVLRLLRLPRRVAAALALLTLAAFVAIVGHQPSVLRAAVMGGLVLAAQLLGRESVVWNSLAAALLVLLALDPGSLVDPGFQLSFAATAGILHLGPPIFRLLEPLAPRVLAGALAVSAGAQLAVTPLLLVYWSQLSVVGVLANLAIVPLAGALTTLGCLSLVVTLASEAISHLMFQSLWGLLLTLRLVVRTLAALPGAVVDVPAPPPLALVSAAGALLLVPVATSIGRRALVATLAVTAVAVTGVRALPDGRLYVLVLDVGQGDAILVRGPDGRALLVDTGGGGRGRADRGERVVLPLLRHHGIRRLAALAVTHGDPDHAGGLGSLLEGIPIDEVWVPAGTEDAAWQAPLIASGVRRRVVGRGDRIWLGPLLVTALHPARADPADPARAAADPNNQSLVLRVEWGLAALVLTGDAEEPAEREVLESGVAVRAPLLKVGHHGSRYGSSSRFLTAVGPRLGLISVGARNPFGHPNPATLGRLADAGAGIYRTDTDGAIEVTSNAERLWVRRWARPGSVEEFLLNAAP